MVFVPFSGPALTSESQVDFSHNTEDLAKNPVPLALGTVFEIEDFSLGVEQTLNIGSQSSGAGAGKIAFNPFSITRRVDMASPKFFEMACSGTAFKSVALALAKSAGGATANQITLRYDFKLVAVKTIAWNEQPDGVREMISFEYGGLQIRYARQSPNGQLQPPILGGWNRVKNILDHTPDPIT
jgi:type VI secretion system secreted protein Hcp